MFKITHFYLDFCHMIKKQESLLKTIYLKCIKIIILKVKNFVKKTKFDFYYNGTK